MIQIKICDLICGNSEEELNFVQSHVKKRWIFLSKTEGE